MSTGRTWSKRARVGLLVGSILVVAPVLAHHGPDNIFPANTFWFCGDGQGEGLGNFFCMSDYTTDLTFYVELSIDDTGWQRVVNTLAAQYDPTDLNSVDHEWTGPVYDGFEQTDIIYQRRTDLPGGLLAYTYCDQAQTFVTCDQHYVMTASATPTTDVICHETGHAVGLTHGEQAIPAMTNNNLFLRCMRTPATGDSSLGTHNRSMINQAY